MVALQGCNARCRELVHVTDADPICGSTTFAHDRNSVAVYPEAMGANPKNAYLISAFYTFIAAVAFLAVFAVTGWTAFLAIGIASVMVGLVLVAVFRNGWGSRRANGAANGPVSGPSPAERRHPDTSGSATSGDIQRYGSAGGDFFGGI